MNINKKIIPTTLITFLIITGMAAILATLSTAETAPLQIDLSEPDAGKELSGKVSFQGSASDSVNITAVEYAVDDGEWHPINITPARELIWNFTLDTGEFANGNHSVRVKAVDVLNRSETFSAVYHFFNREAPNTLPEYGLIVPDDPGNVKGEFVMILNISDPDRDLLGGRWRVAEFPWREFVLIWNRSRVLKNLTWDSTTVADGSYEILFEVWDTSEISVNSSLHITTNNSKANVPPVLSIISPENGSYIKSSTIKVNGTVRDNDGYVISIMIKIDDGKWRNVSSPVSYEIYEIGVIADWEHELDISRLEVGPHKIRLKAEDNLGEWGFLAAPLSLNKTPSDRAEAVLTPVSKYLVEGETVTFDGSPSRASKGDEIVGYDWELRRFGALIWNVSGSVVAYKFTEWGIYSMMLEVTDSANKSDRVNHSFLMGRLVNLTRIEATLGDNGTVELNFSEFIDSYYEDLVRIIWTVEHGSPGNLSTTTLITPRDELNNASFKYRNSGTFNLTLRIGTLFGNFTRETFVVITNGTVPGNSPPVTRISATEKKIEGEVATLDASGSYDPDGDNISFIWYHTFDNTTVFLDPYEHLPVSDPPGKIISLELKEIGLHIFNLTVFDTSGLSSSMRFNVKVEKDTTYFDDEGSPDNWTEETIRKWEETFKDFYIDPKEDLDGDGVLNYIDRDIDDDGFWNQEEIDKGTDPTDADSFPKEKKEEADGTWILLIMAGIFVLLLIIMIFVFIWGRSPKDKSPPSSGGDFF